ncbi:MAG: hypothetical protein Q9176_001368 [Flavoplaca citrina]
MVILSDYYPNGKAHETEIRNECRAIKDHPLEAATLKNHLLRIRSLIAKLQKEQDAEDHLTETMAASARAANPPGEMPPTEYSRTPSLLDDYDSTFPSLLTKSSPKGKEVLSTDHDGRRPGCLGGSLPFGSRHIQPQHLPEDVPQNLREYHQGLQFAESSKQQKENSLMEAVTNPESRQQSSNQWSRIQWAKTHAHVVAPAQTSPISGRTKMTNTLQDDCGNAACSDTAQTAQIARIRTHPEDSHHYDVYKPSDMTLSVLRSTSAAIQSLGARSEQSQRKNSVDIDVAIEDSSVLHKVAMTSRAAHQDQDGWNMVEATEDGYDAVDVEEAGNMLAQAANPEHRDNHEGVEWDLCG